MKKLLVLMLFILMHFSFSIAQHFSPVWSGNPNNAMNFYIGSATINGIDMVAGDEIGIFDGGVCVGAAVLSGPISPWFPINTSEDNTDPGIDGFISGHTASVRFWDASRGSEISDVAGDESVTFTGSGTAFLNLSATVACTPPAAPTVGTITQPTCATATGSVVLNGLPSSGSWTINPGGISGSGTSTTITGLTPGTYNFTVTDSEGCTSDPSDDVVINAQPVIPDQPGAISGSASVCEGSSQTYSITAVSGATSYTWTLPNGWSGTSTSTSITATTGESGTISVTANNLCGSSIPSTLSVTVNALPTQPGSITGNSTVCEGSSQTYSISPVSGATSYTWTLPGSWSGSSTSTSITATVGASGGTISVTANNSCGSSSASTLTVSVNALPAQPGIITGSTTVCSGSSQTYSISPVSGATSYTWTLPGGWSGSSTTTSITATAGTSGTISVTANNSCGSSSPRTLSVSVITTPATPGAISGSTSVCEGSSQTYSITTVPSATSYNWTLPGSWSGSSTTNSITATIGASGGTISVSASNSCGTSAASTLGVSVTTVPGQPGTITGETSVCQGSSQSYSISPVSGATSYTWTLPGGWTGTSTSTSITATAGTSGTISVTANNSCGSSTPRTLSVTVTAAPAQPGSITGSTTVCQGSSETYSISPVSGATSYTWTLPGGWTGSSTTTSITATVGASGGTISVTASNSCGTSSASTLSVSVPTTPAQPGPISGSTTVCSGSSETYSVAAVSGATYYTWTLPGGWSGSSSTNSITVTVGASGGTISVRASNACGTSSASNLSVSVMTVPPQPGVISGETSVCQGSSQTYSISSVSGATSYTWTLPSGWSGSSTSTSITATAGNSGTISVTANNSCGSSSPRTLSVSVTAIPAQPGAISGNTVVCEGTSQTYSISAVSDATYYTWTLPSGWSGSSTTTSITGTAGSSGDISVTASNSCGTSSPRTLSVYVSEYPSTPVVGTITQPTCAVATGSVVLSGLPSSGTWTLTRMPGGTTTTGTGTSTTVSGLNPGTYTFTVTNASGCISEASEEVVINVSPDTPPAPIVGTITQPATREETGSVELSGLPASGTWTITANPGGATNTGTGTSITITDLVPNTYTFTVTNAAGCVSIPSAEVFINAVPEITDQNVIEVLEDNSLTITVDHLIIDDPDNSPSELTLNVGSGSNYSVTGNTITPVLNYNGTLTVPVTVNDGIATSSIFDATVTVTPVNDVPEVSDIPDQTIVSGESFDSIPLNYYVSDIETDVLDIVWTYSGNSELAVEIVDTIARISLPSEDWTGCDTIIFIATDDDALNPQSDSTDVIFTVNAHPNTAPVVSDIPDQTIDQGESFDNIMLDEYVEDDYTMDQNIVWEHSACSHLSISINNRVATITTLPDEMWYGSETITFTAFDDNVTPLSASDDVTFTVNHVNAIVELSDANIHIYPNPSSELVYIEFEKQITNEIIIEVTDILGQVVLNGKMETGNMFEINVSDFQAGLYFIRIATSDDVYTSSIIVEN